MGLILGMSAEDAISLLEDTARQTKKANDTIEKRVSISEYVVNLFKHRCSGTDVSKLLFDERYRECEYWSHLASQTTKEEVYEPTKHRAAPQNGPEGILKIDQGQDIQTGFESEVNHLRHQVTELMVGMNVTYHDLGMAIVDMETHLDHLLEVVGSKDWVNDNNASEGSIRIASMKFASELKRFAGCTEDWVQHTDRAHQILAEPATLEDNGARQR